MLKADGLEPTMEMIEKEKCGEITAEEIREAFDGQYRKTQAGRN